MLNQAYDDFAQGNNLAALKIAQSLIDSRHVKHEANLLCNRIETMAKEEMDYYSSRIEADSKDALNYFYRARSFDCLGEQDKANADMQEYSTIMSDDWSSDFRFSEPKNLGSGINNSGLNSMVGISKNDLSLYILVNHVELWASTRVNKDDSWELAQNLGSLTLNNIPTIASSFGFIATVTTDDALECYYGTVFPGGYGRSDIWFMKRQIVGDVWGPLKNLGQPVNTKYDEFHACISPNGLELYFSGRLAQGARPDGYGRSDLWFTQPEMLHGQSQIILAL